MDLSGILDMIRPLLEQYLPDWFLSVALVIGVARAVFKPLMEATKVIIDATPTPKDDAFIKKVEESKVYYWVFFALDFLLSLKPAAKLKKEK